MDRCRKLGVVGAAIMIISVSACGSEDESSATTTRPVASTTEAAAPSSTGPAATTTALPARTAAASTSVPAGTTTTAARTTTPASTDDAILDAPDDVGAGEKFDVEWTGPSSAGDYITIVAEGTTEWTDEPYFYAAAGSSPGSLVAPITDGGYELWYVSGVDEAILARRDITVAPFEGALGAPVEVVAGTRFMVAWNGPNGPGDYVTIVAKGSERWTDEIYFYTASANPGELVAAIEPGEYELWYVVGSDSAVAARRPITVTPFTITLDAPERVEHGATFRVDWTGPNGPSDYLTIVPAGSPEGTYLSYAYTAAGSPATLMAPDAPGSYEIWYASDRVRGTFASIDIEVT